MLLFAVPTMDTDAASYNREHIRDLREMLVKQQEDLTELTTIAGYLKGFKDVGIDRAEKGKYAGKIARMQEEQKNRFDRIDEMVNQNRKEIKKEKTSDQTVLTWGKEVRKLEAGLRTLCLFICDVVEMLAPDSTLMNRADDRIGYVEKRSAALEAEIKIMSERLSFL